MNDVCSAVVQAISRLKVALDKAEGRGLRVDLRKCQYIGPDGAVVIASYALYARSRGATIEVLWPDGPRQLRDFCERSGLFDLIEHPGGGTNAAAGGAMPVMPLQRFDRASFQDADGIVRLVHSYLSLSDDTEDALRVCVNEVTQNIEDHAESPVGGVMMARYLRNEVRVAIADCGLGIDETLRPKYPELGPSEAIRKVLRGGYTAHSRDNNQGLGINNLVRIIKYHSGGIFIVSRCVRVDVRPGREPVFGDLPRAFWGTGVFFTLPLGGEA